MSLVASVLKLDFISQANTIESGRERERERTDALHDGEIPPGPDAAVSNHGLSLYLK